jgi:TctA family transporter
MWCTIINGVLLVLSTVMFILMPDVAYSMHAKVFSIPQESVGVAVYSLIGVYKIFFVVFNLVPYLALLVIGKK